MKSSLSLLVVLFSLAVFAVVGVLAFRANARPDRSKWSGQLTVHQVGEFQNEKDRLDNQKYRMVQFFLEMSARHPEETRQLLKDLHITLKRSDGETFGLKE